MKKFRSKNVFNLSHEVKLTCDMGKLIPFLCEEVLPGDTFKIKTDMVLRLAPLLAPVMHNIDVFTHFFFVPNRLIFDQWEDFITGGKDGKDATIPPTIKAPAEGGFTVGSLADYFGIPTGIANLEVSALPFRAYDLIYNEWYRDENLQDELVLSKEQGLDTTTVIDIQNRCWEHDYFTSALPFQQRGEAVHLPSNMDGHVTIGDYVNGHAPDDATGRPFLIANAVDAMPNIGGFGGGYQKPDGSFSSIHGYHSSEPVTNNDTARYLDSGSAADINDLRLAFQLQRWLEKNARAGYRYVEQILAHFGVRSSDARLQRPEYLGGGRSPVIISEVLQTSAASAEPTPLGNMGGHGVTAQRSHQFRRFFEEHGVIIGILSIMPKSNYQQGLAKKWTRSTKYDYYWPAFSHLGEQAIKNKEIYAQGTAADDEVFGFQPRYEEYRHESNKICGQFKDSLAFWHLGRIFNAQPNLNADFVKCNPSTRIFAVQDEAINDHCWVQMWNDIKAVRPIPKHGNPGFIDHE